YQKPADEQTAPSAGNFSAPTAAYSQPYQRFTLPAESNYCCTLYDLFLLLARALSTLANPGPPVAVLAFQQICGLLVSIVPHTAPLVVMTSLLSNWTTSAVAFS